MNYESISDCYYIYPCKPELSACSSPSCDLFVIFLLAECRHVDMPDR